MLTHHNKNALFKMTTPYPTIQKDLPCYLLAATLVKFGQTHIIQPQNSRKFIYEKKWNHPEIKNKPATQLMQ